MSVEQRRCAQCGTKLTADGPNGLCPACGSKLHPENPAAPNLAVTSPWGSRFSAPKTEELACYFPQLEITELLGQGGMGAVYKARQLTLDRLVAVKILPAEVAGDPAFAERFTREARALARLNHPNIVGIHDFGQAGGLYYFVMEYVDGDSLRQLVAKKESSVRQTLALVPQMCDALQFAHDEGIVHRDIKPENILIDKRGRVKVADFGLAKLLGRSADEATLTRVEQVMGTPLYMAPEQMQGSHAVDHRADIYSLGVVFYEMLTGELPLGRFAPPSQKVEVDMRLDEVVLRALEREPDRRYQHASDLKTDVEAIASQRQAVALQAAREPLPMGRDEPAGQRGDRVLLDAADRSTRPLQRLGLLLVGVVLLLWGAGLLLRIPYFVSKRERLTTPYGSTLVTWQHDRKSALTRAVVAVVTSATGIVLLILAASIRQRWKVTYHGHSIRFENSILRSSCLIVDGRVLARGKARLRVGTRVPFGAGAGDLIVVRTRAGLLSYRCQISARAEDQDGKIA